MNSFTKSDTSKKPRPFLEVLAGIFIVFFYAWSIHPLYPSWLHVVFGSAFIGLLIYSKFSHNESLKDVGFRRDNFILSTKIIFPWTFFFIILLVVAWRLYFPINTQFYREGQFWYKLIIVYPVWALFQQYIALIFFFRRLREVFFPNHFIAIFVSALIFSAAHLPNLPLTILCFLGGLLWAWAYHKTPNIFPIAVSHALLGVICSNILLMYTIIGPNADFARWTQKGQIYSGINLVNGKIPDFDDPYISIDADTKSVKIVGWVVGVEKGVHTVLIRMGRNDHKVHYGIKRPDVAKHYDNPGYMNSGFRAQIPINDLRQGYYSVALKVLLENSFYYQYPRRIWIKLH